MSDRPDLRDLVGDDVPPDELAQLRRVDALLRSVPPPPPEVPQSLTRAVLTAEQRGWWTRPRLAAAAALAATLAAAAFGLGAWTSGDDFEPRRTVALEATENARGAEGVLRIGEASDGNTGIELEVAGLKPLGGGGYYTLWLEKDGEYGATCGTFNVDEGGRAEVYMNASYDFDDFDAWVVSPHPADAPDDAEPVWLLKAEI